MAYDAQKQGEIDVQLKQKMNKTKFSRVKKHVRIYNASENIENFLTVSHRNIVSSFDFTMNSWDSHIMFPDYVRFLKTDEINDEKVVRSKEEIQRKKMLKLHKDKNLPFKPKVYKQKQKVTVFFGQNSIRFLHLSPKSKTDKRKSVNLVTQLHNNKMALTKAVPDSMRILQIVAENHKNGLFLLADKQEKQKTKILVRDDRNNTFNTFCLNINRHADEQ